MTTVSGLQAHFHTMHSPSTRNRWLNNILLDKWKPLGWIKGKVCWHLTDLALPTYPTSSVTSRFSLRTPVLLSLGLLLGLLLKVFPSAVPLHGKASLYPTLALLMGLIDEPHQLLLTLVPGGYSCLVCKLIPRSPLAHRYKPRWWAGRGLETTKQRELE